MSVNAAGSASNVSAAITALRQAVSQEQVAGAAIAQASQQTPAPTKSEAPAPAGQGRGENVDILV